MIFNDCTSNGSFEFSVDPTNLFINGAHAYNRDRVPYTTISCRQSWKPKIGLSQFALSLMSFYLLGREQRVCLHGVCSISYSEFRAPMNKSYIMPQLHVQDRRSRRTTIFFVFVFTYNLLLKWLVTGVTLSPLINVWSTLTKRFAQWASTES